MPALRPKPIRYPGQDGQSSAPLGRRDLLQHAVAGVTALSLPGRAWILQCLPPHGGYALHKGDVDLQAMHAACPWLVFADGERRGYGVVDITPQQLTTTLRVVDDVTRKDSRIETLAQFVVQAGTPSVQRVA